MAQLRRDAVGALKLLPLAEGPASADAEAPVICFADGGTLAEHPGWAARSLLALLSSGRWNCSRIVLVCLRGGVDAERSRVFHVAIERADANAAAPRVEGLGQWEKDHKQRNKPRGTAH